jgi:hypothetical protein
MREEIMKHIPALALAALLAPSVAQAANPPSTALVGTVTNGLYSGSGDFLCYGNDNNNLIPVPSTYIRATPNGPIILDPGTFSYQASFGRKQAFFYRYTGTASLHFSSATGGLLHWDFLPTGHNVDEGARNRSFSNYSQTYDAGEHLLTLSFTADFGRCSLPVKGIFHG